jgi:heme O synthase-like polyprenyltransferase
VAAAVHVLRARTDDAARRMFRISLAFLFGLFLAMNVELVAGL